MSDIDSGIKLLKIGYSSDIESRLKQYEDYNPLSKLLKTREGNKDLEKYCHRYFSRYKYEEKIEWFYYNKEIVEKFDIIDQIRFNQITEIIINKILSSLMPLNKLDILKKFNGLINSSNLTFIQNFIKRMGDLIIKHIQSYSPIINSYSPFQENNEARVKINIPIINEETTIKLGPIYIPELITKKLHKKKKNPTIIKLNMNTAEKLLTKEDLYNLCDKDINLREIEEKIIDFQYEYYNLRWIEIPKTMKKEITSKFEIDRLRWKNPKMKPNKIFKEFMNSSYENKDILAKEISEKFDEYYINNSLDGIIKQSDMFIEINKIFKVNQSWTNSEVKIIIGNIFSKLNITDTCPKASILSKYFELKPIKIKDSEGNWINGFNILSLK